MPDPLLYLKAMGAAAIVSATIVLMMVLARRHASTTWLNSVCVLGIGLGLVVGYGVVSLRLAWPPVNGLDRFLTITVPLVLGIELIAGIQNVPRWVAWLLRMSLAATIPRILLHGSVYLSDSAEGWTRSQTGAVLVVCGALLAGVWSLLSWLSQRSLGTSISLALCLPILCAGLTVMMAGYIKGGVAAFPLVATLVATTIGARLMAKRSIALANFRAPAIVGVGVVGLFGLLFVGHFFGRLSTGSALVMLHSPLLCWVAEMPRLRHRKPWLVGSLRLVLVAIPLLVVLAAAKRDFDRNMAPVAGKYSARCSTPNDNYQGRDVSGKSPRRTWDTFSTCLFHSVSSTLKTCSATFVGNVKTGIMLTLHHQGGSDSAGPADPRVLAERLKRRRVLGERPPERQGGLH